MFPRGFWNISGGFWVLCAWFGLQSGWGLLAQVLGACCLHELGHFLALQALGATVRGVRLTALGAVMDVDTQRLSYAGELVCILAGPGVNLVCALFCRDRWELFGGMHLALCLFNLLPMLPLDGGRALELASVWLLGVETGERLSAMVGALVGASMGALLVWMMAKSGGSLWLLPMAVGFFAKSRRFFVK